VQEPMEEPAPAPTPEPLAVPTIDEVVPVKRARKRKT